MDIIQPARIRKLLFGINKNDVTYGPRKLDLLPSVLVDLSTRMDYDIIIHNDCILTDEEFNDRFYFDDLDQDPYEFIQRIEVSEFSNGIMLIYDKLAAFTYTSEDKIIYHNTRFWRSIPDKLSELEDLIKTAKLFKKYIIPAIKSNSSNMFSRMLTDK